MATDTELARLLKVKEEIERITREDLTTILDDQRKKAEQALATTNKRLQESTKKILGDLEDPLQYHVDRESDIEFLPDGRPNMTTVRRAIFKWQDLEGNVLYTKEAYLPLDQIRALRDKVISQGEVFHKLSDETRSAIITDYNLLHEKSELGQPFQDYLFSQKLGERFSELKTKSSK